MNHKMTTTIIDISGILTEYGMRAMEKQNDLVA